MGGKMSRTKGASGERDVCALLKPIFPDAQRELDQYQAKLGRDLKNTQPLCIQIKRLKKVSKKDMDDALEEAIDSISPEYDVPIVLFRSDRQPWMVYADLAALMEIARIDGFIMSPEEYQRNSNQFSKSHFYDTRIQMLAAEFIEWYQKCRP
jgi:hypothetical protein